MDTRSASISDWVLVAQMNDVARDRTTIRPSADLNCKRIYTFINLTSTTMGRQIQPPERAGKSSLTSFSLYAHTSTLNKLADIHNYYGTRQTDRLMPTGTLATRSVLD